MNRMNKNEKLNSSNRGGALLSVIVVMAVVGILGALVLSMSYTNFRMKVIDRNSTNNFYTAEKVLEEVCTGLSAKASTEYKNAYTYVMGRYSKHKTIESMRDEFGTMFVVNMVAAIQGESNNFYDVSKLQDCVKDVYPGAYTIGTTATGKNEIETLEDGLCLRNVKVTYEEKSYYNSITTDIKIKIPEVAFSIISTMPEIAEYSFISEGGVKVGTTGNLVLNGKAYAGTGEDSTENVSIFLASGSKFDATGSYASQIVSKGEIVVGGTVENETDGTKVAGNSEFTIGTRTSLWAQSVLGQGSGNTLNLVGRSYIQDDTTLSGVSNELKLGGQYYGYSNDGDISADGNSAIIINGQDTTLDMSALDSLVLAGTAFVGTAGDLYDTLRDSSGNPLPADLNMDDILMGDSIAIKSNQLAYMVPTECEGIASNPMTYNQYEKLISNNNWENDILRTPLRTIGRSLVSYGVNEIQITPVFTNRSGGAVYLYLTFSDANIASKYFMDYYGANTSKVQKYLKDYVTTFKFNNSMSRVVTQGNYLVPLENGKKYTSNTGDVAMFAQELTNYASSFEALCTKLITNKSSLNQETEVGHTVFYNLIDEEKIEEFIAAAKSAGTNPKMEYTAATNSAVFNDGEEFVAIVVDNKGKTAYKPNSEHKKGIILATGDVDLSSISTSGWQGLVICGGKLYAGMGGLTLNADADAIGKSMMLSCEIDETTYTFLNFFKSGSNYSIGDTETGKDMSDIRNCLSFENYKSE